MTRLNDIHSLVGRQVVGVHIGRAGTVVGVDPGCNPTVYTRAEYMADSQVDGPAAHRKYYGQFVTEGTIARVVSGIGREALLASKDPHMNDIPLHRWDRLVPRLPGSGGFAKAGDYYTLAHGVCLAKEAARQWLEAQEAV